jgi:hypothetical protein
MMKEQDYQQAHKWMTLSLSYLHLSMDPKKAEMDEKFEAELDRLSKEIELQKQQHNSLQNPQSQPYPNQETENI